MTGDTGIYQITCWATGWAYIGMAPWSVSDRWRTHRNLLNAGKHGNPRLQADWTLFGIEPFELILLEPIEYAAGRYHIFECHERDWIIRRQEVGKCYNRPLKWRRCPICAKEQPIVGWLYHLQCHISSSRRPAKNRS